MPASAHDVAAEIRRRLPGVPMMKLHKLLYYCQGHHLAHFGRPLFSDAIVAFDMGPVVADLWRDEKYGVIILPPVADQLSEGELNTIGYVVSRYGKRTGRELALQTHGETPWLRADEGRQPGTAKRIEQAWISEYFADAEQADREEDPMMLDSDDVKMMLADANQRRAEPATRDSIESLVARRDELAQRLARD